MISKLLTALNVPAHGQRAWLVPVLGEAQALLPFGVAVADHRRNVVASTAVISTSFDLPVPAAGDVKACSGAGFCASPFLRAAGISLADDWRALGVRATDSRAIVLAKVFVPDDAIALRRPRGQFHPAWNVILTGALPLIMSVTPALQRLRQV